MAQANYDKFIELRKSGIGLQEARKQAYGEVPTTTPNVSPTPSPMVNAPVETGLSTPIQPVAPIAQPVQPTQPVQQVQPIAPVEVKAPEPVKAVEPTNPIDKNAEIRAKNEAQMALNKQKSELAIADRKRQAEEAKISNTPTDQNGILNSIISGVSVPKQNTQAYRNAEFKANNFKKFNSMTPTQLFDNLKQGQISSEMDQLLSQNPNYSQAKQKLNEQQKITNLNNTMNNIVNGVKGKEVAIKTPEQYEEDISIKLMQKYGLDDANAQAFSQFVATDEEMADNKAKLLDNRNQLSNINRQINDATTLLNQGIKDIRSQYPDMPSSGIITLIGSRLGEFNDAITNLNSTKSLLSADIKDEMDLAKSAYDAKSQDIQSQNAIRQSMALNEYKSEFDKQQQQEALNDPATAIPAMIEEYKKLGVPFSRSTQQVIADFETSGKDLPTYLSELQGLIQSKPEYKRIQAIQQGQMSDAEKLGASQSFDIKKMGMEQDFQMAVAQAKQTTDIKKMGMEQDFQMAVAQAKQTTNNKWTKLDDGMYTNEAGDIITADELKSAKLLGNSNLTKQVGEEGGECGVYASRGVGMSSTPGGNSKEARIKAFSDKAPQVGGLAFFGGAGYDPTYGHISIVTGVNADGTINVKDSNYNNDKKVTERTVPANSATGFYNNTPLAQSVQPTGTQGEYTDQNINDLAYLVGLQEKNPTQAAKDMKELGYTARDLANYKAGNVPLTENQKNSSIEVMNAIKDLADPTKYEWNDAVGKFDPTRLIGTQDAEDATMAITNLVAKLTLPNLGVLKGPMSDKDIQFIKEASSKLSTTQSNDSFERNLIDAYNLSARRAGMSEITKLSDIKSGKSTAKTNNTGSLDYSKYETP